MNEKIELEAKEMEIFSSLKKCYEKLEGGTKGIEKNDKELENWRQLWESGGKVAHNLYMMLSERGIKVKYKEHLYQNRVDDVGVGPEALQFHNHIHAIEDIINFVVCSSKPKWLGR